MSHARYIVADVFEGLGSLDDGSVDLVMTSPPFLALRSYLPADHPDKAREIGSEATPGAFIDRLLDVVEECARVLAPHGSLVFELGDTYAGSGGAGGDYNEGGLRDGAPGFDGSASRFRAGYDRGDGRPTMQQGSYEAPLASGPKGGRGWPLDKSKVLIPQLFAIALAYGFNPLTGRVTEPWRVRNTVAWCRPNPPVGRDGDKFRSATSFLTVACKARDRYWDGDAVRTEHAEHTLKYDGGARPPYGERGGQGTIKEVAGPMRSNPAGAPLLDWWKVPTHPYAGAHYATWPPALVVPVVKAMCPQRVCRVCGKPSTRITERSERSERYAAAREAIGDFNQRGNGDGHSGSRSVLSAAAGADITSAENITVGWSDCLCIGTTRWRPGVVLDPFAGSGTTLAVATGHGLDAIGIDLDARNAELAYERIGGMFLTIETLASETVA